MQQSCYTHYTCYTHYSWKRPRSEGECHYTCYSWLEEAKARWRDCNYAIKNRRLFSWHLSYISLI